MRPKPAATAPERPRPCAPHPARLAAASTRTAPRRLAAACAIASAAASVALAPRDASADAVHRLALRGELGAAMMLPEHQRSVLGYELGVQGSVRPAVTLAGPIALQLAFSNWLFPSRDGTGRGTLLGGGLRIEPRIGTVGRLALDANAGAGLTGADTRFMFDVGLGFEFAPTRWLGVGPVVRYARIVTSDDDVRSDAQLVSFGLSLALRVPEPEPVAPSPPVAPDLPPPAPGDRDGDAVLDPDDQCPTEPAGAHADPSRRGCPLRDADGDGVFDPQDQCATTPQGANPDPERAGCPDGDDDNDGVLNHQDQCRAQHQGAHPDPNRRGCPTPDRDNDSVPDPTDHCPDQPGAPHPDPNRNGCPGLVRVEGGQIRINRPVFFATNRDRILPRSFPVLQAVADALRAVADIRRVAIEGHTDDVGDDARNLELSQRRANSVMAWLVAHGIDAARLEARGLGETRPMVPVAPDTPRRAANAARAQNRRVEFRIVDPAQPASDVR